MVKNAYPELPELPYQKTSVTPLEVQNYINTLPIKREVMISTYTIFIIESGHGKKGVNNNYAGIQADGSRLLSEWASRVTGTCVLSENMTGKARRFVCFDSFTDSIDYLANRLQKRGVFIGGTAIPYSRLKVTDPPTLARAYWKEWVQGDNSEPPADHVKMFIQLYTTHQILFK
jgi:hypothetical protein